jgi:uncharacterized protein (DUF433 family)
MSNSYVILDPHNVYRVRNTDVMLDGIIADYFDGQSPETIQSNYPSLTLEQVHGAIAWILGHPVEVSAYAARQNQVWADLRAKVDLDPSPVVQRLRALRRANLAKSA